MTHLRVSLLSHTSTDQIFLSKATDYFLPNIKLLSANAFSRLGCKIFETLKEDGRYKYCGSLFLSLWI